MISEPLKDDFIHDSIETPTRGYRWLGVVQNLFITDKTCSRLSYSKQQFPFTVTSIFNSRHHINASYLGERKKCSFFRMGKTFWLLWLFTIATLAGALPVSFDDNSIPGNQAEMTDIITNTEFSVDLNLFSQLLSTHLLFDHLDNTLNLLSKKISRHFQEAIHITVKVRNVDPGSSTSVDMQILEGQLKGAVGSYIEDQLPELWNLHTSALDKIALQSYIEQIALQLCNVEPSSSTVPFHTDNTQYVTRMNFVSNTCLTQHSHQFLSSLDRYIGNNIKYSMTDMIKDDLPNLYESTRIQVQGILNHFNEFLVSTNQLELSQDQVPATIDTHWLDSPAEMDEILQTVDHWAQSVKDKDAFLHSVDHFTWLARAL
ncbi:uncharacterized protein BYT42DRAFT_575523 [Radiomyces spectabilis]|uniref:uncharacterized protein n=1 Tax=Radiomyces spectabilis TaxID=64574 RepID=UPI00222004CF|nr:uncharacterized protein BYT42DRAFT_575523 [Radiomyces spectabilis]KAI8374225.1 hypothetical protein BYT42DRAFT_575523 [Radiomyces spectabilis]